MGTEVCEICSEAFTALRRRPVACNFCHGRACLQCTQTYLLGGMRDPQCMFCRADWGREFLDSQLPVSFRTGPLRQHRAQVLLDREKSLLPETMAAVERQKRERQRYHDLSRLSKEISELMVKVRALRHRRHALLYGSGTAAHPDRPQTREVICLCPRDQCRGYIVRPSFACGVCNRTVCNNCMEPDDEGHLCQPEAMATARLIERETRPCPGCHIPIYRTEGCAQMWCVQCNTAFDWNSGQIVRGVIHNPHYFEWLRRGGSDVRAPGDMVCGGLPNPQTFFNRLRTTFKLDHHGRAATGEVPEVMYMYHALRLLIHVEHIELPARRQRVTPRPNDNETLRIRYLLNEITEQVLATELQRIEKRREKERAILDIFEMFYAVGQGIMQRFMDMEEEAVTAALVGGLVQELTALRQYFNCEAKKTSQRFQSTVTPNISEQFVSTNVPIR